MQLFLASVLLVFVAVAIVPGTSLLLLIYFVLIVLNIVLFVVPTQLYHSLGFIYLVTVFIQCGYLFGTFSNRLFHNCIDPQFCNRNTLILVYYNLYL